jgi:Carboxypeptidase regulatory-like domain
MNTKTYLGTALLLIAAFPAPAQVTSMISGTVTDSKGSVVPGAQVIVTNTDTNIVHPAQTKDDGSYAVPLLPVGTYKIEVQKEGFEKYVQSGIVLQLNTNPAMNVVLQIGSVMQTVEVQADAAMVETQSTGVGQVIQPEQVVDLPLNDRQASQLIALSGAAIVNTAGGVSNTLDYPTSISYSVAGSASNETNYNLDGAPNMDYRTNIGATFPFPDALQEFKVESSSLPASVGSRPGGAVGAITKGGTNTLHGDAFEFLRNGIMDAAGYQFGNTADTVVKGVQDTLKRNQFGGVLGGPIIKNKVFFFYGGQGTTERSFTTSTRTGLPTPAEEAGNFTAYLSTPCQTSQKFLNNTVPSPISGQPAQQLTTAPNSNIILPQWLNTPSALISAKIEALLPAPIDACGDYPTVAHTVDREYQHVGKIDWQRTAKDSLFFRYFISDYNQPDYFVPGNLVLNTGPGLADRVQNVSVGDTYLISPSMVNSLRLTFVRTATQRTSVPQISNLCTLGMIAWCQLPNYLSYDFGAPGFLGYDFENTYGVGDNILWQLHSHSITFGFNFQHVQMNGDGVFQVNPGPTVTTGSASYTGQALADFVTGEADGYAQGGGQLSRDGENYPSLFFQDNWKVARRLQVNYGVRWDPFFPQHNKYKMVADFDPANYNSGVESTVYPNSPPGITYPGDAGFNGTSILPNHLANVAPRVGLVWDPTGKGTMTVRAGYGLTYSTTLMWNQMHVVLNPPYGTTVSFVPSPVNVSSSSPLGGGGVANPWYNQPGGNQFPSPEPPPSNYIFPQSGAYVFQNTNNQPAHTQSWNVSFQYQVTQNWLFTATYLGNKSNDQWLGEDLNQAIVVGAGMTAPGIVSTTGMTGTSGPCTLLYGTKTVAFPACNASSTTSVNGVGNEAARTALNLSNPKWGPDMATGNVLISNDNGYSSYDGLLVSLQHRLSHGLSVLANYTWSHCLDLGEGGQDIGNSYQNPLNHAAEYGNCGQDRRHLVNVSLVMQMPKLSNPWLERIVGGWSTSQIFTAASGSPFNETDGTDQSLSAVGADRPTVVGNPLAAGPVAANPACNAPAAIGTERAYFNPCAFVLQPLGTFGNEGRNVLFGPGHYNLDTAIWRSFRIREKYRLDFRGEAFNILNHAWWANPSATMSGTSGLITGAGNSPRILQVAMKFVF